MRQSEISPNYNLQLGPVSLRADASVTGTYNDNINYSHERREADFIINPQVNVEGKWQVTDLNAIVFNIGAGYQYYISHTGVSGLILTPNSNLEFNIFVGDVKIKLFDNFSYLQDPVGVGQLSNISQFARFQNDAGLETDWDLGDFIVSGTYDHTNYWVFQHAYDYLSYQADTITPRLTYKVTSTIDTGVAVAVSDMRYDNDIQNDNTSISAGPFVSAQITDNLAVNAQGGWYASDYAHGGLNGDSENANSYYASIAINHRINDSVSETLTGGREFIPGVTSNFTRRTYASYGPSWQATNYIRLAANLWWENLDDSSALVSQHSDRYGAGVNASYAATDHLTLNLGYQYILKTSDIAVFGYRQNTVDLGASYQF